MTVLEPTTILFVWWLLSSANRLTHELPAHTYTPYIDSAASGESPADQKPRPRGFHADNASFEFSTVATLAAGNITIATLCQPEQHHSIGVEYKQIDISFISRPHAPKTTRRRRASSRARVGCAICEPII